MIVIKQSRSPLCHGGVYLVAAKNGNTRALVDPYIATSKSMPRLTQAVDSIGAVFGELFGEDICLSVKIDRAPRTA